MMSETMVPETAAGASQVIEDLRAQVADLTARLARLEALAEARASAPAPPALPAPVPAPVPVAAAPPEAISEETLLVISAAIAAFLGERAHIRSVRLISSRAWAQEGRVSIQASHRLH